MIDSFMALLNSPVPHIATTPNDGLYFTCAMGWGAIAFTATWIICLILRNGPRGLWYMLRLMQHKEHVNLSMVLLNNWKVHGHIEDTFGPVDLREPNTTRR